jgi:hypothetical protein
MLAMRMVQDACFFKSRMPRPNSTGTAMSSGTNSGARSPNSSAFEKAPRDVADDRAKTTQRRDRIDQARILNRRNERQQRRGEDCRDLALDEGGDHQPHAGREDHIEQRRCRIGREASGKGHAEYVDGEEGQHHEVQHGKRHVRQLLAKQEFRAGHRRHVEVDDGAQLLLAHHAQHRQHGRYHQKQDGDDRRNDRHKALDVGIVAVTHFKLEFSDGGGIAIDFARLLHQPRLVHTLHIAADGFGAHRHGAVHPCADLDIGAARNIPPEAGRYLDGETKLAARHAPVEIVIIPDRLFFDEVARPGELKRIVAADGGVVAVQHGEGQILDVHADAEAHDEHQEHRADNGETCADRIAAKFQRLALRIGEHAPEAEEGAVGGLFRHDLRFGPHRHIGGGLRLAGVADRLFQIGDESFLQRFRALALDDAVRRVRHQHLAGMHERYAVAQSGLVHEVGRHEDGDAILA